MTTNFGFAPGILEYWILLSDWRNGSFAILMALSVLFVGYVFATGNRMLAAKIPGQSKESTRRSLPVQRRTGPAKCLVTS